MLKKEYAIYADAQTAEITQIIIRTHDADGLKTVSQASGSDAVALAELLEKAAAGIEVIYERPAVEEEIRLAPGIERVSFL